MTTFPSVSASNKDSTREANMPTYLRAPNVQADAAQTLYLMNPSYSGYSDPSNTGNMVVIGSPAGVDEGNPLSNSIQQHFIGFRLPSGLAQNSPQSAAVPPKVVPNMGHQLSNRTSNQAYNSWNSQNELRFVSPNDSVQASQSIVTRLSSVDSGQQTASDFSHYSLSHQSLSPLEDQQTTLFQNRGLNLENAQVSTRRGQGLSLSLSPQQPSASQLQPFHMQVNESGNSQCISLLHAASDGNSTGGEGHTNKWTGNLSSFHASSWDGIWGTGYQNMLSATECSRPGHLESGASILVGRFLANSKYLKAAQQLLVEVVSFERAIKNNSIRNTKAQTWMASSSIFDGPFAKDKLLSDTQGKTGTASIASFSERTNGNVTKLPPTERQELQAKKSKLMGMLEEVDQRYRRYYSQLRLVMSSFESAAGLGSARTYTALALQTISKHFRCLKDAIVGQIRAASRALGEEDPMIHGKGETSRLFFVDQQLQEQRALQQLGMMQQHAWRPQRGLPERAVSILRAWLFEHFLHPYPKDADKVMLAKQTGLTRSQVSNWFINARVRLWKPMVEEMYLEETREAEMETGGLPKKARVETTENTSKGSTINDSVSGGESHRVQKEVKMDTKQEGMQECNLSDVIQSNQSMNTSGTASDSHYFHDDNLRQGLSKSRNGLHDSLSTFSPSMNIDMEMRLQDNQIEGGVKNKLNIEERNYGNNFTSSHGGFVHTESLDDFGSYARVGGVNTKRLGNRNVSLTLGLQHCDGLSLSGQAQKHHLNGQNIHVRRREDAGNGSDDYYSLHEDSMAQGNAYEAMNIYNQKQFATQFLQHDFVA